MKLRKKHLILPLFGLLIFTGWQITKNLLPGGAIYLHQDPSPKSHAITVIAEDLKHPFFGTAFHLHYDPDIFTYDHFSIGNFFSSQNSPLVIVREDENPGSLIVGITLKRGEVINRANGNLLHFYFKPKTPHAQHPLNTPEFTFSHEVFSTFDNGRKNLTNILFKSI